MAVKIQTVNETIDSTGLKILAHGLAGSGKTVMCATGKAPTLILSIEGGLLSLKGAPEYIHVVEIETLNDMEEVLIMLRNQAKSTEGRAYEWVAIDSSSDIAETVLKNEMDKCNDPRKSYPAFQAAMLHILKAYRDLANLGYNVIVTAKQEFKKDEFTGITLRTPSMPGNKLGPAMPYLFDEVFALRVEKDEEGNDYRVVQTSRDIMYEAKDRSGVLDLFEEPNLYKIRSKIMGEEVAVSKSAGAEASTKKEFVEKTNFYWINPDAMEYGICSSQDELLAWTEGRDEIEEVEEEVYHKFAAFVAEQREELSTIDEAEEYINGAKQAADAEE